MQINSVAVLALIGSAIAQSSSSTTSASNSKAPVLTSVAASSPVKTVATTTVTAATAKATGGVKHIVQVGNAAGALTFTPSVVSASIGHMVEFVFNPHNHSVAQAAFDSPCVPMDQSTSMKGKTGFFSGFFPVGNTSTTTSNMATPATTKTQTFTIMVNSTDPMWFYCSQMMHCQAGMVGVINPKNSTGQTLATFMAGAKKAPKNISPAKISGGCDSNMIGSSNSVSQVAGAAKATGAKSAAMKSGTAQSTGMMKMNMTMKSTTKAAAMTVATSTAPSAMGITITAAAKSSASASLAAAPANSTGIKQSNTAAGARGLLDASSSLGLLGCLAASVVLFA